MDPDALMHEILDALTTLRAKENAEVRDAIIEHLRNLAEWLERGGFPPQGTYREGDGQ